MANFHKRPRWRILERHATSESAYRDRRAFLVDIGLLSTGALLAGCTRAGGQEGTASKIHMPAPGPSSVLYPAARSDAFALDRPVTDETVAATYNNFYEFTTEKFVWRHVRGFTVRPWTIRIDGRVEKPIEIDYDDLVLHFRVDLEERLYRHRCVEAWAMAVPWTGIPMKKLVAWAKPLSDARYVRMESFDRPEEAPTQRRRDYFRWPYYEGLSMAEATNELAFLATGIYGHELPKQHGAPMRLVVPWKYGFKGIKSIVRFEFTTERPATFWNDLAPREYDFDANVDPAVPHPRWSQATERMIGTNERRDTLAYNGYGDEVAALYR